MCVEIVPPQPVDVKPERPPPRARRKPQHVPTPGGALPGDGSDADDPARLDRDPARATPPCPVDGQGRPAVSLLRQLVGTTYPEPQQVKERAGRPAWLPGDPDRRILPRHASILLTTRERDRLLHGLWQADRCKTRFVACRKCEPAEGGYLETRMVIPTACGTKYCDPCDRKRRAFEAFRVQGHWRVFWTMGIPGRSIDAGTAWRTISKWVGKLFAALRKEARKRGAGCVEIPEEERDRIRELNNALDVYAKPLADLQYAWCLEPHVSGWPHIHFVVNATMIPFAWLKAKWSQIIGATVRWIRYERVHNQDGICRYLSKYISKTQLTPEIIAILYKKKQWASTVPKPVVEKDSWIRETEVDQEQLYAETLRGEAIAADEGWTLQNGKRGVYAIFTRSVSEPTPAYRFGEWRSTPGLSLGLAPQDRRALDELSRHVADNERAKHRTVDDWMASVLADLPGLPAGLPADPVARSQLEESWREFSAGSAGPVETWWSRYGT